MFWLPSSSPTLLDAKPFFFPALNEQLIYQTETEMKQKLLKKKKRKKKDDSMTNLFDNKLIDSTKCKMYISNWLHYALSVGRLS